MTVSFASPVFTVTGGFRTGTATSATANTLTQSTATFGTAGECVRRAIWIHTGTGAGQRRIILSHTNTQVTVDQNWTTTPDATSQFIISHNLKDIYDASTANATLVASGGTASPVRDGIAHVISLGANKLVVGDGSTKTFLRFGRDTLIQTGVPAAAGPDALIRVRIGAVFQWGSYDAVVKSIADNGDWITTNAGLKFDRLALYVDDSALAECYLYGLKAATISDSNATGPTGEMALEPQANAKFEAIGCTFADFGTFRAKANGILVSECAFGYQFTGMGVYTQDLSDLTFQSRYLCLSGSSFVSAQTFRFRRPKFKPKNHNASSQGAIGAKAGHTFKLIDPTWLREVTYAQPATDTWQNGANIQELFTVNATAKTAAQAAVSGVLVSIQPTAGTQATIYNATTNGSGVITEQEVLTGKWDSTSGTSPTWPIVPAYSNYTFRFRVRAYGYLFQSGSATLSAPLVLSLLMLPNADVTMTQSAADAVAGVTVTDHGATPVSHLGGTFGITLDCGGNTLDQVYHHLQSKLASTATFQGKSGVEWHNMLFKDGANFRTEKGDYYNATTQTTTTKGVRVINFSGGSISKMETDSGAFVVPSASVTVSITNVVVGSRVLVSKTSDGSVLLSTEAAATTVSFTHTYTTDEAVTVVIRKASSAPKYQPFETGATITSAGLTVQANQQPDTIAL